MSECYNLEYSPPLCVWEVIEESVSAEKVPVIRTLLGESKVDYANDLRNELNILLEIWNEISEDKIPNFHISTKTTGFPEPPKQREMLIREIQLLLQNLKENENDFGQTLPSDSNEQIIKFMNYISEDQRAAPSPNVLLRPSSRDSSSSLLDNGEIGLVAKNIEVLEIETPIDVLKRSLQCECEILTEDIEYIRKCVEEGRCDFEPVVEPSLNELKQERKKLENHLMKSIELNPSDIKVNTKLISLEEKSNKIRTTTPVVSRKNLPPVRPASASSYQMHERGIAISNTVPRSTNSIVNSSKNLIKHPLTPSLGTRSHTYPIEKDVKPLPNVFQRRNSMSMISNPENSTRGCYSSLDFGSSFEDSSPRTYLGSFCGTPDSGVCSRPISQLGLSDSTNRFSKLQDDEISNRDLNNTNVQTQVVSNDVLDNFKFENAVSTPFAHVPKPPSRRKPQSVQSTKFRRIKASGPVL
uniref:coiled-coil domain-containing protein 24-like n=1 Tax=Styela clava TaxID=7725 RepID=UPI00193A3456|nr:coiled-coil domain-containing protein 24-like [Styela clava]